MYQFVKIIRSITRGNAMIMPMLMLLGSLLGCGSYREATPVLSLAASVSAAALPRRSPQHYAPDVTQLDQTAVKITSSSSQPLPDPVATTLPLADQGEAVILNSAEQVFRSNLYCAASGEGLLTLTARGRDTDWAIAGRESAVMSIYLDGQHNQEVILYRGETLATYQVLLGAVHQGSHVLTIRYRPELSASGASGVELQQVSIAVCQASDSNYAALAHAPIIYARPDAFSTDTPLFLTVDDTAGLRYTAYLTNEDGGTLTADLLALWGRAADIDWVYAITGQQATYQGFLHRILAFHGRYEDSHPILRISTRNNLYSDRGESPYKLRLPVFPQPLGSREEALDRFPWVYRLTGVELAREGKTRQAGETGSWWRQIIGSQVGDLRNYLIVEFEHPASHTNLGIRLQLRNRSDRLSSLAGRTYRAIGRNGLVRTAIELPNGTAFQDIVKLEPILADGRSFTALPVIMTKAFALDAEYRPVALPAALGIPGP
ncbi:MAG: hypothetical protein HY692_02540 [Cyanobacteria bacterium NC_groundwater_1444_Ag_S-0.65um_54_12]|nr:hypothetical protein [Cyanobacteria bacterium NC_groundwater_1444_Ag_S-0.65um_54_12]